MGSLKAQALSSKRKLSEQINGQDVLARELVNDDLDRVDELTDEYAELRRTMVQVAEKVADEDDADARKTLQAEGRDLARQMRAMNTVMLDLFIEAADGVAFGADVLAGVPVRIQTTLSREAGELTYGKDDEDPTAVGNANA